MSKTLQQQQEVQSQMNSKEQHYINEKGNKTSMPHSIS